MIEVLHYGGSKRLGLFAVTVLVLSPILNFGLVTVFQSPVVENIVPVAILLLGLSFVFGIWSKRFNALVKIGVFSWSLASAALGPVMLISVLCMVASECL